MRWAPPPRSSKREPVLRRLDRFAGSLNPPLFLLAVMLAILNISCYAALTIHRHYEARPPALPQPAMATGAAALSGNGAARLPPS